MKKSDKTFYANSISIQPDIFNYIIRQASLNHNIQTNILSQDENHIRTNNYFKFNYFNYNHRTKLNQNKQKSKLVPRSFYNYIDLRPSRNLICNNSVFDNCSKRNIDNIRYKANIKSSLGSSISCSDDSLYTITDETENDLISKNANIESLSNQKSISCDISSTEKSLECRTKVYKKTSQRNFEKNRQKWYFEEEKDENIKNKKFTKVFIKQFHSNNKTFVENVPNKIVILSERNKIPKIESELKKKAISSETFPRKTKITSGTLICSDSETLIFTPKQICKNFQSSNIKFLNHIALEELNYNEYNISISQDDNCRTKTLLRKQSYLYKVSIHNIENQYTLTIYTPNIYKNSLIEDEVITDPETDSEINSYGDDESDDSGVSIPYTDMIKQHRISSKIICYGPYEEDFNCDKNNFNDKKNYRYYEDNLDDKIFVT